MKPQELIERLEVLAQAGSATQTVLVAPINPAYATQLVRWLNTDGEMSVDRLEGHVTSQDLRDFLNYVNNVLLL